MYFHWRDKLAIELCTLSKNLFLESFIECDRFKNNGQLNPGTDENSRVRQMPNGNLFISPVELNDEGVYKCHAANELGEASSTGNLTVLGESFLLGKKN